MRITSQIGLKTKKAMAWGALMVSMSAASAQGVPIEDDDLASVWGQAMFTVVNTEQTTAVPFDFTRITLNADIKLNANLTALQFGKDTTGADIDIGEMRFVSSGAFDVNGKGVDKYVKLTDPYIEFVYKNQGDPDLSKRDIVGMRFGFGAIDGNIGLKLNALKGNILLKQAVDTVNGVNATDAYGDLTLNSTTRATQFTCGNTANCTTLGVGQVGSVTAAGASDFFVSLLSSAVTYADGTTGQEGVSMNWTKGVSYVNARGVILDNPLPPLRTRQGG
ncbi:MAG: hypothetical protein ACM3VZ_06815 [Acidobacteriota bacterium]